jgi:hypothetical protein
MQTSEELTVIPTIVMIHIDSNREREREREKGNKNKLETDVTLFNKWVLM